MLPVALMLPMVFDPSVDTANSETTLALPYGSAGTMGLALAPYKLVKFELLVVATMLSLFDVVLAILAGLPNTGESCVSA